MTERALIGTINEINLLQHLSFKLKNSLRVRDPWLFRCGALESLSEVLCRRAELAERRRSLEYNQGTWFGP